MSSKAKFNFVTTTHHHYQRQLNYLLYHFSLKILLLFLESLEL